MVLAMSETAKYNYGNGMEPDCTVLVPASGVAVSDMVSGKAAALDVGICLSVSEAVSTAYRCAKGIAWRFARLSITVKAALTGSLKRVVRNVYRRYVRVVHRMRDVWAVHCSLRL